MFRKIEIWVLYLVILLSIVFSVFFGLLVRQELIGHIKFGWLSKAALFITEIPVNALRWYNLTMTGEFNIEDKFPQLDGFQGVGINDYFLLLSRFDGDNNQAVIELVDLKNFKIVHTWSPDIDSFNTKIDFSQPDWSKLSIYKNGSRFVANTPLVDQNLNLIFHGGNPGTPLYKIDACSNLLWLNDEDGYHHSIEFGGSNNEYILVPSYKYPYQVPINLIPDEYGVFSDDAITYISSNTGDVLKSISVTNLLLRNGLHGEMFSVKDFARKPYKDPIHLNDIIEINKDFLKYKKGDLFFSVRSKSTIYAYRPSEDRILNVIKGRFFSQHDIDVIDNTLSIFNNNVVQTFNANEVFMDKSNVLFFNLKEEVFELKDIQKSIDKLDLKVSRVGAYEQTTNGEHFLADSNNHRLVMLGKDGRILFTYLNRDSSGVVQPIGWGLRIVKKSIFNNSELKITCE